MSKYDDLEKLQALKESGSITDVEFEIEKKKILNEEEIDQKENNLSIAGLVLGIISFVLGGLITGIIGIVLSAKAKRRAKKENRKDEKATIGLIFSIVGVVKASITTLLIILCFGLAVADQATYEERYYEEIPEHRIHRTIEFNDGEVDEIIENMINL